MSRPRCLRCEACEDLDGAYCSDACADQAALEWAHLKGTPYPGTELSETDKQDIRDAGRGHLLG